MGSMGLEYEGKEVRGIRLGLISHPEAENPREVLENNRDVHVFYDSKVS